MSLHVLVAFSGDEMKSPFSSLFGMDGCGLVLLCPSSLPLFYLPAYLPYQLLQ